MRQRSDDRIPPPPLALPGTHRRGFTAIELLIVIGLMLILMAVAVPSVIPALRKGALNNAATDITSCWRQARYLAMTTAIPSGINPPHFGMIIRQVAGTRPYVALIYDNVDASGPPKLLTTGEDPDDVTTYDSSKPPVVQSIFNRNVIVASAAPSGTVDTSDRTIVVYAQYQTGLPIAPADVVAGRGMVAAPTSLGVSAPSASASTVCPVLNLQTLDYTQGLRGYCLGLSLYHAGAIATRSVQE